MLSEKAAENPFFLKKNRSILNDIKAGDLENNVGDQELLILKFGLGTEPLTEEEGQRFCALNQATDASKEFPVRTSPGHAVDCKEQVFGIASILHLKEILLSTSQCVVSSKVFSSIVIGCEGGDLAVQNLFSPVSNEGRIALEAEIPEGHLLEVVKKLEELRANVKEATKAGGVWSW
ncbi:hypothetical protein BDZ45DRAFT_804826 [Acephala macrosclerotiorum]|nr:hypothetical protein BDZ45DRAFT_804826 [Acephala macrosclerotiorum]